MDIEYRKDKTISSREFIELLKQTTLGSRRPLENKECIQGMLDNADLLITAWQGDRLVGVARSVTDFHYCCYLSDLAVSENIQAKGIGKGLIKHTFSALKPGCKLNLLSAPQAVEYYPKIGFTQHNSAWVMSDISELN